MKTLLIITLSLALLPGCVTDQGAFLEGFNNAYSGRTYARRSQPRTININLVDTTPIRTVPVSTSKTIWHSDGSWSNVSGNTIWNSDGSWSNF